MGHYASIREWCETIGIKSQREVNKLGKATLAFCRLHPPSDGTNTSIRPVAEAFIDQEGRKYFRAGSSTGREILEAVVGIIKAQRRYRLDNQPRLNQMARERSRRRLQNRTFNRMTGSEEDAIEISDESHDERSDASTEDPPWLPDDHFTLEGRRTRKRTGTVHERVLRQQSIDGDTIVMVKVERSEPLNAIPIHGQTRGGGIPVEEEMRVGAGSANEELRGAAGSVNEEMRGGAGSVNEEMRSGAGSVNQEMRGGAGSVNEEMRGGAASVNQETRGGAGSVDREMCDRAISMQDKEHGGHKNLSLQSSETTASTRLAQEHVAQEHVAQEHEAPPAVEENRTLLYREESFQFTSLSQKAQALGAIIHEIESSHREREKFVRKESLLKYLAYVSAYEDTIFAPICDKMQETCTRRLPLPQGNPHAAATASSDTTVDYAGMRWEFKSLTYKTDALGATLNEVEKAVGKWIASISQVEHTQLVDPVTRTKRVAERNVAWYLESEFLPRIRLSLQENGAKIVQ